MKYEVPYNFDLAFVGELQKTALLDNIEFIYLPAWKDDCVNTRMSVTFGNYYPKSYAEYIERLVDLRQLNIPLCILMQRNASMELVEKYHSLGIRHFIINDDELARRIKERWDDVRLSLSVTRVLTFDEICDDHRDFTMYDSIVLFYWFNRHFKEVTKLPKKYNYTIMCNNDCYWDCKWHDIHWFAQGSNMDEYMNNTAPACTECGKYHNELRDSAIIEPEDLRYFDPYVHSYKLVDRIWSTEWIMRALEFYATRNNGADPRHTEDFYNIDVPIEGTFLT